MRNLLLIVLVLISVCMRAQERVTTFGVEFKPIIPSNLLNTGETAVTLDGIDYELNQRVGHSFGGVLRFGLTKWLSLESGISYTRRNFTTSIAHQEFSFADTLNFRVIGYEIPLTGMVFVQLSDEIFMNTAFGLAIDMFPSDVGNASPDGLIHQSFRRGYGSSNSFMTWGKLGLIANVGFEYRTKESGYFYIGGSYHRPFTPIYDTHLFYTDGAGTEHKGILQMSGNYLTLDLKYFFHEEPKEKKVERDPDSMPSWMKKK